VQQARLSAVTALVSCGSHGNLGDEPDMMSSPLKMQFGDEPLHFSRGVMVGNVVFFLGSVAVGYAIVGLYSLIAKEPFGLSALRLRMPGIVSIVAAVLLPPSVEHATELFLFGDGSSDVGFALLGTICLVLFPIGVAAFCGYLVSQGRVVLHVLKKQEQQQQETTTTTRNEDDQLTEFEEVDFFRRRCPAFSKTKLFKWLTWLSETEFEYLDNKKWNNSNNNDVSSALLVHPDDQEMTSSSSTSLTPQQNQQQNRQREEEQEELRRLKEEIERDNNNNENNSNNNNHNSSSETSWARVRPNTAGSIAEGNEDAVTDFLLQNPFLSRYGAIFED
jgi:hypothetical protein